MHAEAHPTEGGVPFASHFKSYAHEKRAQQMGMWLFLVNEILLFAGLFVAFAVFKYLYPETFTHLAHNELDWKKGALNTGILLLSSFTVCVAVYYGRQKNSKMVGHMMLLSIVLGCMFFVVKYFEYSHKFHVGTLPGKFYFFDYNGPGSSMFFTLYFLITGLHGLHVLIGVGLLAWVAWRGYRGDFDKGSDSAVELTGMYWHLVDLIWIYVFPIVYLMN